MKYFKYLTIALIALMLVSFTASQRQRKSKRAAKAPFGYAQSVREITYHAIEDSSGSILKGDIISDTDYNDRVNNMKNMTPVPEDSHLRNVSELPIVLWVYDEYGDEIENDKCHANGSLAHKEIHVYNDYGDVKEIIDSTINNHNIPPTVQVQQYTYKYDSAGKTLVRNKWDYYLANMNNPTFSRNLYFYDSTGKVREEVTFNRDTINPESIIWSTYNEKGKLVETDERRRQGNAPDLAPFEKNDYWYDKKGRLYDKATYHQNQGLVKDEKIAFDSTGKTITTYSYSTGRVLMGTVVKRIFNATNTTQEDTYDGDGFLTDYTITHDSAKHMMDKGVFHITYKQVMGGDRRYHNAEPGDTVMIHHIINDNYFNVVEDDSFSNNGKPISQKSYQYTYDDAGNWVARIQFDDNKAVKITERGIEYFKDVRK